MLLEADEVKYHRKDVVGQEVNMSRARLFGSAEAIGADPPATAHQMKASAAASRGWKPTDPSAGRSRNSPLIGSARAARAYHGTGEGVRSK